MTDEELARLEELAEAATPGPWIPDTYDVEAPGDPFDGYSLANCQMRDDAAFIATARTAVPALIAALRAARAEVEKMDEHIDGILAEETARVGAATTEAIATFVAKCADRALDECERYEERGLDESALEMAEQSRALQRAAEDIRAGKWRKP